MAKKKTLVISGPMDAKHVGGVNIVGSMGGIDSYFVNAALVPDELPSHTFVATGKTEVPRRSHTIASTLRRPSLSIKRSLSKLRRRSGSHHPEHCQSEYEHQAEQTMKKSDSINAPRSLRMQSSISRLRQRVGLDRDLYGMVPVSKTPTPEPQMTPKSIQKDYPPLNNRKALTRLTTASSIYTNTSEIENTRISVTLQRQASVLQRQPSTVQRRLSPIKHQPSNTKAQLPRPPVRPKRVDSGTAIELNHVPVQERPIPFKDIMAVSSLAERMAMYKKTREYWASADHGLITWIERAVGPKAVADRL
ncbi:hypothetical protein EJ02DRAFT_25132 [Clathrospora elynae]|uniref:Uncharacterized protein n=1 Tax=Clathrospora elynae TaxID=706981 RepID=A0A6A5SZR0_9PLEO|nr:hypothetical protein EJ02DRAFT_25132 [Clathrospora elynae]